MILFAWLILCLPLAAALAIHFGLRSKPQAARFLATAVMFVCFGLTLAVIPQWLQAAGTHAHPVESSFVWIPLPSAAIEIGILLNGLSVLMLLIVTGIGSLIFLYSMTYMREDPCSARFFASLSLFAFSMLGIVLSNNLIQTFIFWELVGLSSYLLIGFWFEKPAAGTAGKKAFLTTRVGDVGMMIGILMLFERLAAGGAGTFNFLEIQARAGELPAAGGWMTCVALFLFMGVAGKSAQVPLHVWLPDAMEGPTPVSALIHAATMVAAGVFLLARLDFLFALSGDASIVIAWIGGLTAFLAATVAVVQNDIKKILAYSTLSQLGYMVLAMGLHESSAGMFHLTTHAFFKALLFLGAGSLIHAFHTQDIWEMKVPGLVKKMPVTSLTFVIGTLALMGLPPLSGFYSKEAVLAAASHGPQALFWLALAVVFLTAFYMGRLAVALFFGAKDQTVSETAVHEADWKIQVPLILLGLLSLGGGFLPIREFIAAEGSHPAHGPDFLLYLSIALALGGFGLAVLIYRASKAGLAKTLAVFTLPEALLKKKYFFDELYDVFIEQIGERLAWLTDLFEKIIIVHLGANGTARMAQFLGAIVRQFQTGSVQSYLLFMTGGLAILMFFVLLGGRL